MSVNMTTVELVKTPGAESVPLWDELGVARVCHGGYPASLILMVLAG